MSGAPREGGDRGIGKRCATGGGAKNVAKFPERARSSVAVADLGVAAATNHPEVVRRDRVHSASPPRSWRFALDHARKFAKYAQRRARSTKPASFASNAGLTSAGSQ
jgi:hypothetical protein